jgi:thiol-disulfide isomerase/thioredoxin
MPQMAELYKKYENNNEIAFLYLSKEEKQVIKNYLPKDENLQKLPLYKIITDDELFATRGIPTTFIINKDGEIVVKDVGSALWNDSSVEDYLNSIL